MKLQVLYESTTPRRWFSGKPLTRKDEVLGGRLGQAHFSLDPIYGTQYFFDKAGNGLLIEAIITDPSNLMVDHEEVILPLPSDSIDPSYKAIVQKIYSRIIEDSTNRLPISLYGGKVVIDTVDKLREVFYHPKSVELWNELFRGHPAAYDYGDPDFARFANLAAQREFGRLTEVVVPEFSAPNRIVAIYEIGNFRVNRIHQVSSDAPSFEVGKIIS
jgi:hypothetical protein